MRIVCLHGYFKFEESRAGELSYFSGLTGFNFARVDDYFTFADLKGAPNYVIKGGSFLGATTTVAWEGKPWAIMRANGLVYDFINKKVVPIASIVQTISMQSAGNYFIAGGMILPGSVRTDGSRVKDYAAFFSSAGFRYSEVDSE